ncbi:hypothetical protein ACP70R_042935 [Stipagrostis hirtigluma subsp. patula]
MAAPEAVERDRLSELPDDLLRRILRFLDARKVVELSRLSRRWRCLWSTMPFVTLRSGLNGSENFGNLLLLLRNGSVPLHTFCLHSWYWKHFNSKGCRFEFPGSVFSCATLDEMPFLVRLDEMPFLVSAWVYVCDDGVEHLARGAHELTAALCNAQHLELFRFNLLLQDMMGDPAHEGLSFCKLKSLYVGEWLVTDFYNPLTYFLHCAPNLASLTLDQWKLYEKHKENVPSLVSKEKKPSGPSWN